MNDDPKCPYGEGGCPMLRQHVEDSRRLERKIDVAIALILLFHGAEILALVGAIA